MRTWILLMCFLPLSAMGNPPSWDELSSKLTTAINQADWTTAMRLFNQAIKQDIEKTAVFYQTQVDKKSPVKAQMGEALAIYYKESRDYEKAAAYYEELAALYPDKMDYQVATAESKVLCGDEKEALALYQNILKKEPGNLSANIFMGNYYYLQGEDERAKVEHRLLKVASPSKKQIAEYKEELIQVFNKHHAVAAVYLEKVMKLFPSVEAQNILERIKLLEKEIKK